jgi:hypothetical protein
MQKVVGIKITWVTMNHPSEAKITWAPENHSSESYGRKEVEYFDSMSVESSATDLEVCEEVYKQTNVYAGAFFERLQKYASKKRGHTAISVGDFVEVDGNAYQCSNFGWKVVSKVDA